MGSLFVVSAPSGTGKTTLVETLIPRVPGLEMSRSYTSRPLRPGERDGVEYHFVSRERFDSMRDAGEFLEWADVFGHLYGTSAVDTRRHLDAGRDLVLVIDVQGASQIRRLDGSAVGIFVLPPSGSELKSRLVRRAEDDEATILRRLANAREELGHYSDYDYVVVNDDLESALEGVRAILHAERLRRRRLVGVDGFVDGIVKAL